MKKTISHYIALLNTLILFIFYLTSCQDTVDYNNPGSEANFTSFAFADMLDTAIIDIQAKTIYAKSTGAGDIANTIATFTLTDGAKAMVKGVEQISGETINDFSDTVTYVVVSGNGAKQNIWKVYIENVDLEPVHIFGGPVTSNMTLPARTYFVNEDIIVEDSIVFELNPGTILQFHPTKKMVLKPGAKLISNGLPNADSSIVFESSDKGNNWQGIILNGASAEFSYCSFKNGGEANAFITLQDYSVAGIKYCDFNNSNKNGILLDENSIFRVFEFNKISNCGEQVADFYPVYIKNINSISEIGNTNSINTQKGIYIEKSTATNNLSFQQQSCPFIFKDDVVFDKNGTSIVINAGVIFKISSGKSIKIAENGSVKFHAKGTKNSPVVFSGIIETAGSWKGIFFGGQLITASALELCDIEFAGVGGNAGAINCKYTNESLIINACKIANTNSNGIYFYKNSSATLMDNVFENIPQQYSNIYYEQ